METHTHHSHELSGKKIRHYFFEFFMLFLAVSAGFFVENLRDHHIEREREEQYMKSLVIDLKSDVINIDTILKRDLIWKEEADSLFLLLTLPDYSGMTGSIYFFGRRISLRDFFYMTDGTLNQLNNAGGLRLISHQDIVDSISTYENEYKNLEIAQQLKELQLRDYRDVGCKIFYTRVFEEMVNGTKVIRPAGNPKLFSQNAEYINELLMRAHFLKRNNAGIMELLKNLKREAINLQEMIVKKYHFDN